jgi:hypothetical protein
MTARADVTAASGGRTGSRWSYLTAGSQAGLPAPSLAAIGERPRTASTAPR